MTNETKHRNEWTVVVNLTSSMEQNSSGHSFGAEQKVNELTRLAGLTKNKPITLVVQSVVPAADTALSNPAEVTANAGDMSRVYRYAIHGGKVESVGVANSAGIARDTTDILHLASDNFPSDKIALIMQGHGIGNQGAAQFPASNLGWLKHDLTSFARCVKLELERGSSSGADANPVSHAADRVIAEQASIAKNVFTKDGASRRCEPGGLTIELPKGGEILELKNAAKMGAEPLIRNITTGSDAALEAAQRSLRESTAPSLRGLDEHRYASENYRNEVLNAVLNVPGESQLPGWRQFMERP